MAATTTDGTTRTGRVLEAHEYRVVLDVDGARQELALAEVTRARVEVEFNRPGGVPGPAGEPAIEDDLDDLDDDHDDHDDHDHDHDEDD